jgi:CheY-like chemotaxis protein
LVEDNAMNQFFAQKLLEGWGIKVEIAQNGLEGVEKFRAKHYDCILMDIQMPEMDGFQATKIIRQEDSLIPIIALTALLIRDEVDHFRAAGMNDYIIKPFVADELQEKLILHIQQPQNYSISTPNVKEEVFEKSYNNLLLMQMMKGNTAQVRQMEDLFIEQSEEIISQMNDAFEQKKWKQIGSLAHKMKASIDMLQINTLKQPIRILEMLRKDESKIDVDKIERTLNLTSNTLVQVCEEMRLSHQ